MALSAAALPASGSQSGQGVLGTLFAAIIAGIVSALTKQLRPRSTRRRTSYARTRSQRKTTRSKSTATRRKSTAQVSVEDVFRDILGNLGKK
jgi:hypothetical protein